ncbi:MAG: murein L,D-transpeptidase catalytic domain family protein [Gammaproteobacteria bacterium]|nr:murein L,D-transpeptidase catalytic domain family protein [Gammaproteobacteria bacterium]MDP2140775.1 murein L,D-transpeptidase catalytic domain family protein [Gammaproteobacteria bacterium]MDP2347029.1 murein L,D-transpeptidase catalytic domain family protein [Gammaproteobacteria bacterium]
MLFQQSGTNAPKRRGIVSILCALALTFGLSPAYSDIKKLHTQLASAAPELNPLALQHAVAAMTCAINHGAEPASRLAIIDFSLPSSEQRLWLFDLDTQSLILRELVAHGQGSGDNYASEFSNIEGSHQSSIGLFRTQESYTGQHGYSLRMDGLEPGINDQARSRAIVIHGADYVDESWVARQGRIGRSHGCPAVPQHAIRTVVDNLKGGQFLFAYYPDEQWVQTSAYLNCAGSESPNLIASGRQIP